MDTLLPYTRIRTIMKSSLDMGQINNEVLFLITKSTELFIKHLAAESQKAGGGSLFKYAHLANYVNKMDNMEFLLQILPKKITVRDFRLLNEVIAVQDSCSENSEEEES